MAICLRSLLSGLCSAKSIRAAGCLTLAAVTLAAPYALGQGGNPADLSGLSLEQLSGLEVTSVSKSAERLSAAPASIFVITHDDIERSGATTIAAALRLAPNLLVTQLGASNFSISARGFGGNVPDQNFSNKLLILIDGRSVYSPLYSGVYLEVQDLVLEDVDRIEVISGPGATLWGANAMNGVINIITRNAYTTRGALIAATGGDMQQSISARYGAALGDETALRVYGKGLREAAQVQPSGFDPHDSWDKAQGGFRLDWSRGSDALMVRGDGYRGTEHQYRTAGQAVLGADVLARWEHTQGAVQWQLQNYFDETERISPGGAPAFTLHTYDTQLQETLGLGATRLIWGAGERINDYTIVISPNFQFLPQHRALTLGNVFAQATVPVFTVLNVTAGLKLEDDPYAGWQLLPDLRLAATLSNRLLLWAAVSRAVRSPTPFDVDVREFVPPVVQLLGRQAFQPEKVWSEQLGVRLEPLAVLSLSANLFYNEYSDLRSIVFGAPAAVPLSLTWGNSERGDSYGLEAWADWQVTPWWRLSPGVRTLHEDFSFTPGIAEVEGVSQAGDDPGAQATLTSAMQLPHRLQLSAEWRYVGALPSPALASYQELSARFAWQATRALQLALAGDNLLHAHHLEYPAPYGEFIDRAVMFQLRYGPQ